MTYEERKLWLCQQCGKPHQCGYANRGLQDKCTALQEWMQCWELGYQDATEEVQRLKRIFESDPDAYKQGRKDAFKMAYKWLIERYDNQGVILIDDIHELYEKMEE